MSATTRWVLAGGGTGGHVMPLLALAEVLREQGEAVLFVGAQRGMETRLVPAAGFELVALGSQPLVGQSLAGRLRGLWALLAATLRAWAALRRFGADVVVSVGGYAAVPVTLAAALGRRPFALLEPNALPGSANRLVARFAKLLFIGPEAAASLAHGPADPRLRRLGIPLRRELVEALAGSRGRAPKPPIRLFVFGGSQGAHQINEALVELAPRLDPAALCIVHQTGEADRERVAEAYAATELQAEVLAFESDMAARYRWADLVLCRAGALTVAELALAGRAALLVPLAGVGGGEQRANARALEAQGAAVVLESGSFSAEALHQRLEALIQTPAALQTMGERAAELARPAAARQIVEECRSLLPPPAARSRDATTSPQPQEESTP